MDRRTTKSTTDPASAAAGPKLLPTRGHWVLSLMLLVFSSVGFWLFSRGFLLTRMVLPDHSHSSTLPFAAKGSGAGVSQETAALDADCAWYPAKFNRAIVLVIDALRIDFATWSEELDSRFGSGGGPVETNEASKIAAGQQQAQAQTQAQDRKEGEEKGGRLKPYHNRLPVIHSLNERRPEQAMLYRFRADPPTTTLQRLKGLTTGQLPTFIDAGSNFAGSAIEEDNWLQALRRSSTHSCNSTEASSGSSSDHDSGFKRNLVFLGDDTWMSLFPEELHDTCAAEANDTLGEARSGKGWTRSRPFPSLNVWDIDTVDDGVLARLPLFLLPPESEEHSMPEHKAAEVHARREDWRRLVRQKDMLQHPDFAEAASQAGPGGQTHGGGAMESRHVGRSELHRDWDMLIAHCLGVDHCGHRYGPDHSAISTKLEQMNKAIEYIVDAIDHSEKSTALFVFGDHGMDPKGDHGGDSPREVDAALWMYSNKKWNTGKGAERSARVLEQSTAVLENSASGLSLDHEIKSNWWLNTHLTDDYRQASGRPLLEPPRMRSVPQIDLVATVSLGLGLPVPFNNLGAVIPEMFASDEDVHGEWGLLRALRLNAAQTMRYLTTYMASSRSHGFSDDAVRAWRDMYERAETSYRELSDLVSQNHGTRRKPHIEEFEEKVAAEYHAFLRLVLGTLWQMWAQFDAALILLGLCIMALVLVALVLLYPRSRRSPLDEIVRVTWKGCVAGGLATMFVFRSLSSVLFSSDVATQMSKTDVSVAGFAIGLVLVFCVQLACEGGGAQCSCAWLKTWTVQTPAAHSLLNGAAFAAAIMHSLAFTSNSFTFSEDSIVHYLLQSLLLIASAAGASVQLGTSPLREKQRAAGKRAIVCALTIMVLNRISLYSTVCREEQLPGGCVPTFYGPPSASISSVPLAIANLSMVWLVPYVVLRFLRRSHSHRALIANLWIGIGMRISMGMAAVYWVLDSIDSVPSQSPSGDGADAPPSDWSELRIVLARMAVGVAVGGGLSAWIASPFCLDVAISDAPESPAQPKQRPAKPQQPPRQAAVILGFGNAFGAAYLAFVTVVFCVLYTFQQPMGGIMLAVLLVSLMFSAELFDALRDALTTADDSPAPSLVPAQVAVMALLAYQGYFATGHQFTLVSLQWSTAFVGIREMNLLICGAIVSLNTLGSFVLTALCVPLVMLWNESLGSQLLRLAPDAYLARVVGAGALYAAYNLLVTTGSALFAAWFRRHLMVWKVFAPRFIFAVPVFMMNIAVVLCVAIGLAATRVLGQGLTIGNAQARVAHKIQKRQ
ncbi:mannose-ethanolamine phosphotransferase gpi13 [Coemansia sp. RSA 1813]|nr:mannose-ethanolamine phosphotransferase gpi13 [Coemansia sp. RSA 1646]KAJ1771084.1 mannose-ethanolamine phosphotransferase gpi13 [Coemansia sp. RSA 1843]KAJ2214787.1 mannose-ethanolamine phosphotransferase gpi13 [Coemansia sp. RSA 487]KAJ2569774.1 mannose-ethanolamine phosphotransferase gpi13 [Coemansia sp. RSA 1813]